MAYGLPASAWLENGFPSAPTSVNGPPKLVFTGPELAAGALVFERVTTNMPAMPISATATSNHASSRTCLSRDRGGASSVKSDHHAQIGAAFGRIESAYGPAVGERNLPGEAEPDAAAALMGGVEGEEDVLATIFRDSGPVVAHLDAEMPRRFASDVEYHDRGLQFGRRADRIAEQVQQGLGKELGIGCHRHRLRFDLDPRVD